MKIEIGEESGIWRDLGVVLCQKEFLHDHGRKA